MGPIHISFRNFIFGLNKPKFLFSLHNDVPSFYLPSLAFIGGDFFPSPFSFCPFPFIRPSPHSLVRARSPASTITMNGTSCVRAGKKKNRPCTEICGYREANFVKKMGNLAKNNFEKKVT